MMANRFDGGALIAWRQHEAFEPCYQIEGQLSQEQVGPVGMEFLGRELLQPKPAFMLLNSIFHVRMRKCQTITAAACCRSSFVTTAWYFQYRSPAAVSATSRLIR